MIMKRLVRLTPGVPTAHQIPGIVGIGKLSYDRKRTKVSMEVFYEFSGRAYKKKRNTFLFVNMILRGTEYEYRHCHSFVGLTCMLNGSDEQYQVYAVMKNVRSGRIEEPVWEHVGQEFGMSPLNQLGLW